MSNKKKNNKKSNKKSEETPEPTIEKVEIKQRPTLILSPELLHTVNFLHREVGKDEWSGMLFYDVQGTVKNLSKMVLTAKYMMIKDVGTSASTEFDYDVDVFDYFDVVPEAEDLKSGLIHTHHDMNNFFSGTDMNELMKNSFHYNYYLSLIMSFDCDYHAKLAIPAVVKESQATIKDEAGQPHAFDLGERKIVYIADCDIVFGVDNYNTKAVSDLIEKQKAEKKAAWNKQYPAWNNPHVAGYVGKGKSHTTPKSITNTKKKSAKTDDSNPFMDLDLIKKALSSLIMGDIMQKTDINYRLALVRMTEVLPDKKTVDEYMNVLEEILDDVVLMYFGSNTVDDIEEFADNALLILTDPDETDLTVQESIFLEELIQTLKFNSTYMDMEDEGGAIKV